MTTLTAETAGAKNASLSLKLKAKSGFSSESTYQVSALQWAAITAICEETEQAKDFMAAMSKRIIP
ncbi:hypothetical protein [Sphingobium chungbukense]|uniref:Uncharacterized protein n=1 Tax=Sphingobium chungbukense TaxID=56193 RepID=A0A0M3AVN7_9SPHN|nr:hypothetical protein [Sphingobium chungbukense]KKW93900.1 hypothetical protein YP76_04435 [Sphingobium chungbukense]